MKIWHLKLLHCNLETTDERIRHLYALNDIPVKIGRSSRKNMFFLSKQLSVAREHCELFPAPNILYIKAYSKKSKTYLDDEELEHDVFTEVKPGQKISLGCKYEPDKNNPDCFSYLVSHEEMTCEQVLAIKSEIKQEITERLLEEGEIKQEIKDESNLEDHSTMCEASTSTASYFTLQHNILTQNNEFLQEKLQELTQYKKSIIDDENLSLKRKESSENVDSVAKKIKLEICDDVPNESSNNIENNIDCILTKVKLELTEMNEDTENIILEENRSKNSKMIELIEISDSEEEDFIQAISNKNLQHFNQLDSEKYNQEKELENTETVNASLTSKYSSDISIKMECKDVLEIDVDNSIALELGSEIVTQHLVENIEAQKFLNKISECMSQLREETSKEINNLHISSNLSNDTKEKSNVTSSLQETVINTEKEVTKNTDKPKKITEKKADKKTSTTRSSKSSDRSHSSHHKNNKDRTNHDRKNSNNCIKEKSTKPSQSESLKSTKKSSHSNSKCSESKEYDRKNSHGSHDKSTCDSAKSQISSRCSKSTKNCDKNASKQSTKSKASKVSAKTKDSTIQSNSKSNRQIKLCNASDRIVVSFDASISTKSRHKINKFINQSNTNSSSNDNISSDTSISTQHHSYTGSSSNDDISFNTSISTHRYGNTNSTSNNISIDTTISTHLHSNTDSSSNNNISVDTSISTHHHNIESTSTTIPERQSNSSSGDNNHVIPFNISNTIDKSISQLQNNTSSNSTYNDISLDMIDKNSSYLNNYINKPFSLENLATSTEIEPGPIIPYSNQNCIARNPKVNSITANLDKNIETNHTGVENSYTVVSDTLPRTQLARSSSKTPNVRGKNIPPQKSVTTETATPKVESQHGIPTTQRSVPEEEKRLIQSMLYWDSMWLDAVINANFNPPVWKQENILLTDSEYQQRLEDSIENIGKFAIRDPAEDKKKTALHVSKYTYESYDSYHKIMLPLCLVLLWSKLYQMFRFSTHMITASLIGRTDEENYHRSMLISLKVTTKQDRIHDCPNVGDFVVLGLKMQSFETTYLKNFIGYVQKCNFIGSECHNDAADKAVYVNKHRVDITIRYPEDEIILHQDVTIQKVDEIRQEVMKVRGLFELANSPLRDIILNPHKRSFTLPNFALHHQRLDWCLPHVRRLHKHLQNTLPISNEQHKIVMNITKTLRCNKETSCNIIEGEAGTGKTRVLVWLTASNFASLMMKDIRIFDRILICTTSDATLTEFAKQIDLIRNKIVLPERLNDFHMVLLGRPGGHLKPEVSMYTLEELAKVSSDPPDKKYANILRRAHLIVMNIKALTNTHFREACAKKIRIPIVMIDDAQSVSELHSLLPLICSPTKLILAGDLSLPHPFIESKEAAKAGLALSLLSRISRALNYDIGQRIKETNKPCTPLQHIHSENLEGTTYYKLTEHQMRMSPHLSQVTSIALNFPVSLNDNEVNSCLPFKPFVVFDHEFEVNMVKGQGSNQPQQKEGLHKEVLLAAQLTLAMEEKILTHVKQETIKVLVITGDTYHTRKIIIEREQNVKKYPTVCKTKYIQSTLAVKHTLGLESDVTLLCVGQSDRPAFQDPRNLRLALTRAKHTLVILGNLSYFTQHRQIGMWQTIVALAARNGTYYKITPNTHVSTLLDHVKRVSGVTSLLIPPSPRIPVSPRSPHPDFGPELT